MVTPIVSEKRIKAHKREHNGQGFLKVGKKE